MGSASTQSAQPQPTPEPIRILPSKNTHLTHPRPIPLPLAGEVLQETHYYPFGARFAGASAVPIPAVPNEYLYNGKEYHDELGVG